VVGASLVPRKTSWTHLLVVRQTVQVYGRPLAYYVDNHSILRWVTHQNYRDMITTAEADTRVRFRRILRSPELASSIAPRANRKVGARLKSASIISSVACPFLARRTRVQELAEGIRILTEVVAYDNEERVPLETGKIPIRRWEGGIAAEQGRLRFLPEEVDLREIFSLHLEPAVAKDGTLPFLGQRWSLDRALHGHGVQLRWIPEKRFRGLQAGQKRGTFCCVGDALQP
jgi:hypothetical protein